MTLSTLMYYTGFDPYSGKKVYVARSIEEKEGRKNTSSGIRQNPNPNPLTAKHAKISQRTQRLLCNFFFTLPQEVLSSSLID